MDLPTFCSFLNREKIAAPLEAYREACRRAEANPADRNLRTRRIELEHKLYAALSAALPLGVTAKFRSETDVVQCGHPATHRLRDLVAALGEGGTDDAR